MPADLSLQIEPIHEAVKAMGWPILMVEGVEADEAVVAHRLQRAARLAALHPLT